MGDVEAWGDHLLHGRGLRPSTVRAYQAELRRLASGMERLELFEVFTAEEMATELERRSRRGQCPRTLNRSIVAWRAFYGWLQTKGSIERNPAMELQKRKDVVRLPRWLSIAEAEQLGRAIEGRPSWAIELLWRTGLRVGELVQMRRSDVDASLRVIRVKGKGGRERAVPATARVMTLLCELARTSPDRDLVLGVGARLVQLWVRRAAEGAGLIGRVTPHTLRHTFATAVYERGCSLLELRTLLGHSSVQTTEIYAHVSEPGLRAAVGLLDAGPQVVDVGM